MEPNEAKYYRNKALCYAKQQKKDLAMVDLMKSLELDPFNVKASTLLGHMFFETGKYEESAQRLQAGELMLWMRRRRRCDG